MKSLRGCLGTRRKVETEEKDNMKETVISLSKLLHTDSDGSESF
jgi:AMMECR1 domain-containing protein